MADTPDDLLQICLARLPICSDASSLHAQHHQTASSVPLVHANTANSDPVVTAKAMTAPDWIPAVPVNSNVSHKAATSVRSFAQVLRGADIRTCDFSFDQLPRPCVKGDDISISIPEEEYLTGLEECKTHLHGRFLLSKGDTPIKVDTLKSKLHALWNPKGKWGLISLGKGYYEFSFSCVDDLRRIQLQPSWQCKPGLLRLFAWQPDFNPLNIKHTNAQCWIRLTGLAQEYWRPKILFAIASCVGAPLKLDDTTSKSSLDRSFGHFARVLVDIDLKSDLRDHILVERPGYKFSVDIEYENLPSYCSNCNTIGHTTSACKGRNLQVKQVYVPKHKTVNNEKPQQQGDSPITQEPQQKGDSSNKEKPSKIHLQQENSPNNDQLQQLQGDSSPIEPRAEATHSTNDSIIPDSVDSDVGKPLTQQMDAFFILKKSASTPAASRTGSDSTQPPTTRLDSLDEVHSSSPQYPTTLLDTPSSNAVDAMRILGKDWGDVSDDDGVPDVSEHVATSHPVVESDMNIVRKLWDGSSNDVGEPVTSALHGIVASLPVGGGSKSKKKKKLRQKQQLAVGYNTRSKANSISDSF